LYSVVKTILAIDHKCNKWAERTESVDAVEVIMKVIGAGFGRTGTLSLKGVLETLGFGPCYHMTEVFSHPEHAPLWTAAAAGDAVDWTMIFEGYEATVDWPGAAFYARLVEMFPDAPVILSVRDPDKWYDSCMQTIHPASAPDAESEFVTNQDPVAEMIAAVVWRGTFEGAFRDKQYAISVFERHIQDVRDRVPADRLLIYEVRQGWEPLCRFLGVEQPTDQPFPHVNTALEWQKESGDEEVEGQGRAE
jgi:hypothetical protein